VGYIGWTEMSTVNILTFIKFGSEKNILDLYENGSIYCNTIEYFRKLEDDYLRGDSYEGTFKITNYPPDSKITLKLPNNKDLELKTAKLHLREFYTDLIGNIYCLTAITKEEIVKLGTLKLDSKNSRFGTHFLLIKDNRQFFDRLVKGFENEKRNIKTGFVKYYDKHLINGELDLFHKSNEFEYQKEFRIIVRNEGQDPIKFQIGSLKEISQIFETKDLDTLVCQYNPQQSL
jgi:hypothetical protein